MPTAGTDNAKSFEPVEVILGLPYLSAGPMTAAAKRLGAKVLISASAFCKFQDFGPVPERWLAKDEIGGRQKRMREWAGWNVNQLKHAAGLEGLLLDSAGFVAMSLHRAFPWTPEQYIHGLCAAYPWERFASMDQCVEPEVARDRHEVRERIAKTIALNRECRILARDAGIEDRLMPVIQGANADDYLRCFDAMSGSITPGMTIGVGSMCRRSTAGDDGVIAIVDRLDRELPPGIKCHLFGVKSDAAQAVAMLHNRVASIDSQAYGIRARRMAIENRRRDPAFSKSNAFVAGIMEEWWVGQVERMKRGAGEVLQTSLPMPPVPEQWPRTVWDALELRARAETNELIIAGELDASELCTHNDLIAHIQILMENLPEGVHPSDPYDGLHQLPESSRENWPIMVAEADLHPAIRPQPNLMSGPLPAPTQRLAA